MLWKLFANVRYMSTCNAQVVRPTYCSPHRLEHIYQMRGATSDEVSNCIVLMSSFGHKITDFPSLLHLFKLQT